MMAKQKPLLVYDGHCPLCVGFVNVLRRLDHRQQFQLLAYQAPSAQRILGAQFGQQIGFTLYLFTDQAVYWAQAAAREVAVQLGMPSWVGGVALKAYPALAWVVSKLVQRRQAVCMPGGTSCINTQSATGSMRLTKQAAAQLRALGPRNTWC